MKKKIIISTFFWLIATSVFASGQSLIPGTYQSITELCSDGMVYRNDPNVMTPTRKDVRLRIRVMNNNVMEFESFYKGSPKFSGSFQVKYLLDKTGILTFQDVFNVRFPANSPITEAALEQKLKTGPIIQASTNGIQLIISYRNFDSQGKCSNSAFVIVVFNKQN